MKLRITVSLLFILIVTIMFYHYLQSSKKEDIQNLANQTLKSTNTAYKAIIDTYAVVSQRHFLSIMQNSEAISILRRFKEETDKKSQAILRGELYRLLYKEYEILKSFSVRQFHFHTIKGESLLRFHYPPKNADPLIDARNSIRLANTKFQKVIGFEGGKMYPGFRYVFPIIDKQEHLGSVEFSISFEAIEKKLKNILPFYAHKLILEKRVSYDKVFKEHQPFFVVSKFDNEHYIENQELSVITKETQDDALISKLTRLTIENPGFHSKLHQQNSFSLPIIYAGNAYVVNFLNIENVSNQLAGHLVSFGKLDGILSIEKNYDRIIILGGIFSAVFTILTIIIILQVEKSRLNKEKMLSNLQKFVDIQDSIVILSSGQSIRFANKKFFDFFGYETLEDFLQHHHCICDRFVNSKGFFYQEKNLQNKHLWIERLLNLPGRQRVVSMLDKSTVPYAFTVSINHFDEQSFVINFTDISDNMVEKLQLQKQALLDPLTKAYNRSYFNSSINHFIEHNKGAHKITGVIFFDIDFFKDVNDTFGHKEGDNILSTLVKLVKKHIRGNDQLIRWGGEEFLIISSVQLPQEVYKQAEHLRAIIEHHDFYLVEKITCSFGVAVHEEHNDIHNTIKKADNNLYQAKYQGRNQVVV